jgi:hypothetical protein
MLKLPFHHHFFLGFCYVTCYSSKISLPFHHHFFLVFCYVTNLYFISFSHTTRTSHITVYICERAAVKETFVYKIDVSHVSDLGKMPV